MEDERGASDDGRDCVLISDIHLMKYSLGVDILLFPAGEVINNVHVVPFLKARICYVRADKTGPASHHNPFFLFVVHICYRPLRESSVLMVCNPMYTSRKNERSLM